MRILLYICLLFLVSCAKENKIEKEIASIPVDLDIERFDQVFLSATPSDLPILKKKYPLFFPKSVHDSIWTYTINDPLQKELKHEIDSVFANFEPVEQEIKAVFQHIKYYFPDFEVPKVYTLTTEDFRKKVILTEQFLLIALNTYLGENHKFYETVQKYIAANLTKEQLPVDIAGEFAYSVLPPLRERSFLARMIHKGKVQYLKQLLVPKASRAAQMGYTEAQLDWAEANEAQIWRYFIDKELLYSTDQKLNNQFLNEAPFSKFSLNLDNESPGRIGVFIGGNIVASYMENNDVSLLQMLGNSSTEIFNKSRYKPKE